MTRGVTNIPPYIKIRECTEMIKINKILIGLKEKPLQIHATRKTYLIEFWREKGVLTTKCQFLGMVFESLDHYFLEDNNFGMEVMLSYDRMRTSAITNTYGCGKQKLKTSLSMNVKVFWKFFSLLGILSNACRERIPTCQWCTN